MKSNIYIKNEHRFVQREIAQASCRLFCLLIDSQFRAEEKRSERDSLRPTALPSPRWSTGPASPAAEFSPCALFLSEQHFLHFYFTLC